MKELMDGSETKIQPIRKEAKRRLIAEISLARFAGQLGILGSGAMTTSLIPFAFHKPDVAKNMFLT